jgi:hypothetical protein
MNSRLERPLPELVRGENHASTERLVRRPKIDWGRRAGNVREFAARRRGRFGSLIATVTAFALLAGPLPRPATAQSFPQGPPNDPAYGPEGMTPGSCSAGRDQFYLWSFIPSCFPNATDPENAAGMSVDLAWKKTTGEGTLIAYLENGVNWRKADARDLIDNAYINAGELPYPQDATGRDHGTYNLNGSGRINVEQYAHDPRIHQPYLNGSSITPEDLVLAFGHCKLDERTHEIIPLSGVHTGATGCPDANHFDNDGNGYANDISGWNFVENTNDTQNEEQGYSHANGQARRAAAVTNNGFLGAGVCPDCRILFIRAAKEDVALPVEDGAGILFAVDAGAKVIVSEQGGSLGFSSFQRSALDYAEQHGVVVVMDSSDFDTTAHTEGMFWPNVLPGQAVVPDSATNPTTFEEGSNLTSWGTHSMLPVPNSLDGSSSAADPVMGGLAALIAAYGKQQAAEPSAAPGTRNGPLSAAEIRQLLISSASPITNQSLKWRPPSAATWSLMYGYGRPNAAKALDMITKHHVPPVATINAPSWYQLVDPTSQRSLPIYGTVSAERAQSATYTVQYALGPEPVDNAWHDLPSAKDVVHGSYTGQLATLDLSKIPPSFYNAPFANGELTRTTARANLSPEQYAIALRVVAKDNRGDVGTDRRAVYLYKRSQEMPGFPIRLPSGGESQPVIAELTDGRGSEVIVGDADGDVYAFDSTGHVLPGWPVHTLASTKIKDYKNALAYRRVAAPREPVLVPPAVGDLFGDGKLEVVVTAADGNIYAWWSSGKLLPGFPVSTARHLVPYAVPTRILNGRTNQRGTYSAPVLADLEGHGELEILQSSWDGWLYSIRPDGTDQPGWPVHPTIPPAVSARLASQGYTYYNDSRLISPPVVGDIRGDGHPAVVVGSQELFISPIKAGGGLHPLYAIAADGNNHPGGPFLQGWPAMLKDPLAMHAASFDFLGEGVLSAQLVDLNRTSPTSPRSPLDVIASANMGHPTVVDGSGQIVRTLASTGPGHSGTVLQFTTTGAVLYSKSGPSYFAPGFVLESSFEAAVATAFVNAMQGWNLSTGATLAGFPAVAQGGGFDYGAPAVVPVNADDEAEVILGTDSMTLHAFNTSGEEPAGWPRFTGGWITWSPSVGDVSGTGQADIAYATREGYVHVIPTSGKMRNAQWCGWQGGPRHTGVGDCSTQDGRQGQRRTRHR